MKRLHSLFLFAVLTALSVRFLSAQNTSPAPAQQIGPGSTGTISPTQGVTPVAGNQPQKILAGALTPQTRQTLQEAMNSAPSH